MASPTGTDGMLEVLLQRATARYEWVASSNAHFDQVVGDLSQVFEAIQQFGRTATMPASPPAASINCGRLLMWDIKAPAGGLRAASTWLRYVAHKSPYKAWAACWAGWDGPLAMKGSGRALKVPTRIKVDRDAPACPKHRGSTEPQTAKALQQHIAHGVRIHGWHALPGSGALLVAGRPGRDGLALALNRSMASAISCNEAITRTAQVIQIQNSLRDVRIQWQHGPAPTLHPAQQRWRGSSDSNAHDEARSLPLRCSGDTPAQRSTPKVVLFCKIGGVLWLAPMMAVRKPKERSGQHHAAADINDTPKAIQANALPRQKQTGSWFYFPRMNCLAVSPRRSGFEVLAGLQAKRI